MTGYYDESQSAVTVDTVTLGIAVSSTPIVLHVTLYDFRTIAFSVFIVH